VRRSCSEKSWIWQSWTELCSMCLRRWTTLGTRIHLAAEGNRRSQEGQLSVLYSQLTPLRLYLDPFDLQ
jgi:hypothetical protein